MESNYIKALRIRVDKHPEWDEDRIWQETQNIYNREKIYRLNKDTFITQNNKVIFIHEGGQNEKQLYEISRD